MILELTLLFVITALVGLLYYEKRENKKERAEFVNALIAKTSEQYRDLKLTEKVKPIEQPTQTEPDLIPESDISDKQFKEMIQKEIA